MEPANKLVDLEIKDAQLIFKQVWDDLEKNPGKDKLHFPREIIWLGGAPGAGKGTNTPFIMKIRDITAPPVVVSDLLSSPEAKKIKDAGGLVGDREVTGLLFRRLLEGASRSGVIVDGFPRTKVQVEILKMFHDKQVELHNEFRGSAKEAFFQRPLYHVVLLFVDENESVARQLKRGREILLQNQQARETGIGRLQEERATDLSEEHARKRYRVFKETTFDALQSLRNFFHYHFIDAKASLAQVESRIVEEFTYQSSLELDSRTFDLIGKIPLAKDLITHARQELVKRLNQYAKDEADLFKRVIKLIEEKFIPIISRHALPGLSIINSEDPVFENPQALAMFLDIFSERGYQATVDIHKVEVPAQVESGSGKIASNRRKVYRFHIRFQGSTLQRS